MWRLCSNDAIRTLPRGQAETEHRHPGLEHPASDQMMLFEVADAAAAPLTAPREIACVRQAPRWDLRVARAMQTRPTRDTVVGNGDGGKQQTPWPQHEPLPFTTSSRGVYPIHFDRTRML
jgi:hypothetical protein